MIANKTIFCIKIFDNVLILAHRACLKKRILRYLTDNITMYMQTVEGVRKIFY